MSEWILVSLLILALAAPAMAKYPDDLPEAEKAMAGTVDPWGLPFSDSLRRFDERFAARPEARFAAGLTHSLVKVWPNKYWFRGESVPSAPEAGAALKANPLWVAAGETESLQIAVLPRMGAPEARYTVEVKAPEGIAARAYRETFVRTAEPGYPRYPVERWPDPLVPAGEATVSGTGCGLFWIDLQVPAGHAGGTFEAQITVSDGTESARLVVPFRVVSGLTLDAKAFPLVAWFRPPYGARKLTEEQLRGMYALVLEHHLQPLDALKGRFKADDPRDLDETHRFLAGRGQRVFELDGPPKEGRYALYDHVKQAGWLDQAVVYSNVDEPLADTFAKENVPYCRRVRKEYPGLRVFLASQHQEKIEQGCDIWMTDLSTEGYDPEKHRSLRAPVLWHYYCHLPIHIQFRAPLTQAPNMEVDCDALQHRLALWMSRHYGARGVFIWAGFWASGLGDDFWTTLALESKPGGYPYGGIHNGNNFLVYPPQSEASPVLPSVRLKVLRDGMEDLALFAAAEGLLATKKVRGPQAKALKELLNPVPGVFTHPQYWDRLPETLLARREALLRVLAEAGR